MLNKDDLNNCWISVTDGLPCEEGYYLGFCPHWTCPFVILVYDADLGGFLDDGDEITHWQPIQAPLEEEEI